MIPQVSDDLLNEFEVEVLPSKTFKMNENGLIFGYVDDLEAVKQTVYLIINIERYNWLIYSWDYGVELQNLIGKGKSFCVPEIERRITEALIQDDRIESVTNFQFKNEKRKIHVTFTVNTTLGDFEAETEVEI